MDLYEEVLTRDMHEIGRLWHHNIISVDKEHFANSVTQMVLAGFQEEVFQHHRIGRRVLSCAVAVNSMKWGSE